jgi:SnoaL-like domain
MQAINLCKQYLSCIANGDLSGVMSLFTANALAVAPLGGSMGAEEFHRQFFAEVRQSRTRVLNIFSTVDDLSAVALHFSHSWLLANGGSIDFEGVNIFELDAASRRFARLAILYDSAPLRYHLTEGPA